MHDCLYCDNTILYMVHYIFTQQMRTDETFHRLKKSARFDRETFFQRPLSNNVPVIPRVLLLQDGKIIDALLHGANYLEL
jgi:hypothetical protein